MSKIKNKIRDVDDSICNQCFFSAYGQCLAESQKGRFTLEPDWTSNEPFFPKCIPIENFDKVKMEGL